MSAEESAISGPCSPTPGSGVGKEKRGLRASKACVNCRIRKTKCELNGKPPCRRCVQGQQECVLATSRRGGRREKRSTTSVDVNTETPLSPTIQVSLNDTVEGLGAVHHDGAAQDDAEGRMDWQPPESYQIDSRDLLNPSDALDLLAQAANQEEAQQNGTAPPTSSAVSHYPPISDGYLTRSEALQLVRLYREKHHPYFPIAYKSIFSQNDVLVSAREEPYLLTAILIVATKNDLSWSRAHEACSQHMESLISKLIYSGSTKVGAVEALLILAEWSPQRLGSRPTIGRGEEDQGAWMQVGCAVRLGYLQNLEQTGLLQEKDTPSEYVARKRLVWAACYMSDRQVSIRLGKGFWSRGPGPTTIFHAGDFPSLRSQPSAPDDLALLFQAQLELTQLFSNVHDVLYSSTSHREHLYRGGEYVRYIDDFSSMLRKWKLVWGGLSFQPYVKATLILSYDFLRLYVNAFAFQASTYHASIRCRTASGPPKTTGRLFSNVAGSPDARFIYESIDAANSLLGTLNSFIDPVTGLRYMPLKYYLYVIYAAVFLFKARLVGALGNEANGNIRRTIGVTIDRLEKSSVSPHSPGHRYARLLYLLWRKPRDPLDTGAKTNSGAPAPHQPVGGWTQNGADSGRDSDLAIEFDTLNGFSWRDLDAVGQFITNDTSIADSMLASPGYDDEQQQANGLGVFACDWQEDL